MDRVIFKKFEEGDIIALFPELTFGFGDTITSYMHVGQHSEASPELLTDLDSATESEYKALSIELTDIGYNLDIERV